MIKASRRETGMKNHIQETFFFFLPVCVGIFLKKKSISNIEKSFCS